MLTNFARLKTIKTVWALAIIACAALIVVAGCISTDRSVKKANKVEAPEVAAKQINLPKILPKQGVATGIDQAQLQIIGQKIFQNETGGKLKNLIFWSDNENFPSLGVGHFIWFPAGKSQGFTESFPGMIRYLQDNGVAVPDWLSRQIQICALWNSKEQLEQERSSPKFLELQQLLIDTSGLQVSYLFQRLDQALPKMLLGRSPERRELISQRFNTIKSSPGGLYPLVDYVNFKGEGVVTSEKHNGVGWGLLQVLELMEPTPVGPEALKEFSTAAELVLMRRVANAPPESNEQRWLPGWRVRLWTYYK